VQGLTGHGLTKMNFDKSTILQDLLVKDFSNEPDKLLGELQFAFVSFLLG